MPDIYDVKLSESYFPAHDEDTVLDTTVGGILRDAAAKAPDKVALIEGTEAGDHGAPMDLCRTFS